MYLKRLQLIGFKTFAERTDVQFSPGVTAIVGPNGSGKSNIADAILWVLGEQKASAIRGTKLQDVIFAGSALRKPTGLAEVSLTVDNSDGSLPLPYDEVTITRRAYRSGEGEFAINKTPCRLKDIHELFLDTGVGRESYALVNQSEVDAVLSADPQARRPLFEEAAGIHKFRVRKREALRKLEATEANLVRVRDVVREIERQLGPLERQAEVANRYNAAKERLESLEKNYLVAEIRHLDEQLLGLKEQRIHASSHAERVSRLLRDAEDCSAALSRLLSELDAQLDGARARHQAALTHVERLRGQREVAEQRGQGLKAQIDLVRAELEDVEARLEAAKRSLTGGATDGAESRDQIVATKSRIDTLDGQRRELLPRIAQLRKAEETRVLRIAERERARAAREAELANAVARAEQLDEQEREWAVRVETARERAAQTRADEAARRGERETAAEAMNAAEAAAKDGEGQVQAGRDALAQAQMGVSRGQSDMASLWSRLQTLQELEAAQEGYYTGVRAVLQAAKRGRLQGEYTVVADAFRAPEGYDVAFETALASSVQDIIVDTEDEAKAGIELLKRERAGRATFLPLRRIRPSGPRPTFPSGISGFLGCAADLATYDARYASVIELLLGRTLICETIDSAIRVADRSRGWSKVVTLSGEALLPSGAISGGSAAKNAGTLLHRKTEIATLTERTEDGRKQVAAAEESVNRTHDELQAAVGGQRQAEEARRERQQALNVADRALDQVARDADRLEREQRDAAARLSAVKSEREQALRQLDAKRSAMAALDQATDAVTNIPGGEAYDAGQLPLFVESDQRLQDELLQLRISLASLQEKARGDEQSVRRARDEIERLQSQSARQSRHLESLQAETAGIEVGAGALAEQSIEAAAHLEAVKQDLEERQTERQARATEAWSAQKEARELAEDRSLTQQAAQAAELQEAKLQMQQSQASARLLEEYDMPMADALALDETPEVAADTPREVARLRRELRNFGDVNTHAATEYAELRERFDSMTTQQKDAELAKDKVLAAIREIDDSTRGLFMASFLEVGAAFEQIFQRLMGGGKTELTLTDPDNLLETGVEIAVQAPGKKKQNLMLLSGGERALTAVALLFAFLKVRPAPFCVMDEVDAPLDGVNVERFANLLRDFGRDGQFLVITHNPSTMEAARAWYGVTMQEPGVSRVLSMEAPVEADPTRATMEPMAISAG